MLLGKYLNKYYLKYALLFIIGIATLVWVDFEQTKIPDYLGELIKLFRENPGAVDKNSILNIVFKTLIVAAHLFVGRIVWRYTLFYASKKIECNLRHQMFLKAEQLPKEYYRVNKVGTIMAWFTSDLETIEEYLGWGTVMMVDAIVLTGIVVYKMISLKWQMAIIVFIPLILIVVWGAFVEKIISKQWELRQKYNDELYDFSQEAFTGIRVIKAFVKENQQIHAFAKVARKNRDFGIKFAKTSILFDVLISLICSTVLALIFGIGGYFTYMTVTGQPVALFGQTFVIQVEELIIFTGYFDILVWPLIALGQVTTMHSRAKGSLHRISEFLATDVNVKSKENAIKLQDVKGEISYKNFSFVFPDGLGSSLKHLTITIKPGEHIGIVGRVGSGKSIFVNVLLRIYNVMNNSLFIDGHDIMDIDIDSLRENISYVPQDNFLFSDEIKNNICFSNSELSLEETRKIAKLACVDDDIMGFKDGYKTVSGERGVTLSGGQKQRISIARALIKNAPILIMDDSVSAVDVKTEDQILKNLREIRKGKTTLVVASRITTVAHLDKVLVLKDGMIEAFDTPKNLEQISETYQKMAYLQKLEEEVNG